MFLCSHNADFVVVSVSDLLVFLLAAKLGEHLALAKGISPERRTHRFTFSIVENQEGKRRHWDMSQVCWRLWHPQKGTAEHLSPLPCAPTQNSSLPWSPGHSTQVQDTLCGPRTVSPVDLSIKPHCRGLGWLEQAWWQPANPICVTPAKVLCRRGPACQLLQVKDGKMNVHQCRMKQNPPQIVLILFCRTKSLYSLLHILITAQILSSPEVKCLHCDPY